jgi:hypothetical protein
MREMRPIGTRESKESEQRIFGPLKDHFTRAKYLGEKRWFIEPV